ncbi:MAG: dehydrogenase [Alphaproteobacteria bacterium]|nr:dehydrogenase [Alphaproteobacteria bacterium]
MELNGKVALVTGGAQGIGAAYAIGLAAQGAAVAVCDILDCSATVDRIVSGGGAAIGGIVDVTDPSAVQALVARASEALGGLHVLVNNAALFGTLSRTPVMEISSADWDRVMQVNVRGPFECVKAVLPFMRAQGYGKIVNIASSTVAMGQPLLLHYVASKGAVVAMTRSLARELGDDGIRVNSVSPGFTLSEAIRNNPRYTPEITKTLASARAIKRDQMPEDLVGAVVFLASPASDFISGQNLIVDGGGHMQ